MTIFEPGRDVFTRVPDEPEATFTLTGTDDFKEQQADFAEAGLAFDLSNVKATSNIVIPRARPHAIFCAGVKQQHFFRHCSADRQAHGRS